MAQAKLGKLQILDEYKVTTNTKSWTEYLCFRKLTRRNFELSIRGYQILGEVQDYYDESSNTYKFPKKIAGQPVVRTEDEYVVGGQLINHDDDIMPIEFTDVDDPEVIGWLDYADCNDHSTVTRIKLLIEMH